MVEVITHGSMQTRHPLLPYAESIFAVVVATLFRLGMVPLVGSAVPFVTYFAASLILAWYRGFGPAAACVLLSIFAGSHFILKHGESTLSPWGRLEQAAVIGFAFASLTVSFLIDFQHRTLARARTAERAQAAIARENVRLLEQAQVAQEELRRSNSDLTRANNELEVFAYSASHDLKEPLRTITIFGELVQRNMTGKLAADDEDLLEDLLAAARRMNTLIDDLLLYRNAAKTEEGPAPGVDASSVVAEVVDGLTGQIHNAGAGVTVAGALPSVAIHRSALAQLFQNLISNSIKYRSEAAPRVQVSAQTERGWCVFSVTDNGMGISGEYKEQIFAPFQRLHGREYPGNGIGLAICQRLVQQYGGRIWLEKSAPSHGSTFCFSVPLAGGEKKPQTPTA
jgi:signal transduction histidine kinase